MLTKNDFLSSEHRKDSEVTCFGLWCGMLRALLVRLDCSRGVATCIFAVLLFLPHLLSLIKAQVGIVKTEAETEVPKDLTFNGTKDCLEALEALS